MNKPKMQLLILVFALQIQFVNAQSDRGDTTRTPNPSDTSIARLTANAEYYHSIGDFERAKTEYLKIKLFHPDNAAWRSVVEYTIADLTLKEGRAKKDSQKVAESRQLLERYIQNYPEQPQVSFARLALSNIYLEENNPNKSLQALDDILTSRFVNKPIRMVDSSAIDNMDEKTALYIRAMLARGYIFLNTMDDVRSSLQEYDEILNDMPDYPEALLGKAQALARQGEIINAVILLKRMIAQKNHLSDFARQYRNELMSKGE